MKIDHIGYAVKKIDKAIESFQKLGFCMRGEITDDQNRNIRICFLEKDGYVIELVAVLDKGRESPVDRILSKNGPTAYHVCYRSSQFDEDIERMVQEGYRVVILPQEAIAFAGRRVAFLIHLSIGMIEILEE